MQHFDENGNFIERRFETKEEEEAYQPPEVNSGQVLKGEQYIANENDDRDKITYRYFYKKSESRKE